jgi:phage shock protein A
MNFKDVTIELAEVLAENKRLKEDLDRLHRERDSFQQQARVLSEEVERLNTLVNGFGDA